jgi:8-oxo-dGTP pyrophosphatase MutT (NUDIX family)
MTSPSPSASIPRQAATVILLREHAGEVQVLMTQRPTSMKFMGGMWVFPGGALSSADHSDAALAALPEVTNISCARLDTLQGERLEPKDCLGLIVAACRETFEETGLLLVRTRDGRPCNNTVIERLQQQRTHVASHAATFAELLAREQLQLDASRLIYWAHWITPSAEPRRFDTRFFAIAAPEGQVATADLTEAAGLVWMSPAQLLAQAKQGSMPLAAPTRYNLEDLAVCLQRTPSLPALFAREATRVVTPILPKMFHEGGQMTILMPWNPEYASAPGESAPAVDYPGALLHLPSKVVLPKS